MKNFALLLILVLSLSSKNISAQKTSLTDSLTNALPRCTTTDDSLRTLIKLSSAYLKVDDKKALAYSNMAMEKLNLTTDSVLVAWAYSMRGNVFKKQGKKHQSKKLHEKSLYIALNNNITRRIAWQYYNLGQLALSSSHYDEAQSNILKSIEYFRKGNFPQMITNCYWALVEANNTDYTDTLIHNIKANINQTDKEVELLFYYLQLANLYSRTEKRNESMYYVQMAVDIADRNKNIKGITKAYNQIASYFKDYEKNYEVALDYYQKIFEISQEWGSWSLAQINLNLGEIYLLMDKDSLANDHFNKGLNYAIESDNKHIIASSYMRLGDLFYKNQDFQDAIVSYDKCYTIACNTCPQIMFHQALVNAGNVYALWGDKDKAMLYYQKALDLAVAANDYQAKTRSLEAVAQYHMDDGYQKLGKEQYLEAYQSAIKGNYLEGQKRITQVLSKFYLEENNYQLAYNYLDISNKLNDSIQKSNDADNIAKLETHFDFKEVQAQQQLEKTLADAEIKRQKLLRNFFVIAFLLVLLSVFLVYRNNARKKRDNKLLKQQKDEIETMSQRLHESDQAKLEFYTNVSHELRTPLTLILGMSEKLQVTNHDNQHVKSIRKNSLKLLQLINHLLDLRKLDESKMVLSVAEYPLKDFISGIVSSFSDFAKQKNIE
ncbi:MAG: tetratricopeptide repeat-containing sensor histidine kinase, partial [Bacteroidales bacterium]|nr:tetratricopeptide repeat-containing sensor histidine kinase [Bacteroidales bacterium]